MSLYGYAYGSQIVSSGNAIPGTSGFNICLRDTHANIIARSGDDVGTIAYGTDTSDLYVYDGTAWYFYDYNLLPIANGLALTIDGSDDHIDCGNDSSLAPANITISAWVKAQGTIHANNYIVSKYGATYGSIHLRYCSTNKFNFFISFASGATHVQSDFNTAFTLTDWHHVVLTYDGSYIKGYVDGNEDYSVGETRAINYADGGDGTDFKIGQGKYTYNTDGNIDEVSVFDSALSASEIMAMYNCGVPNDISPLNPVSWWRGGDGVGDTDSGGGAPANGDAVGTVVDQVGENDGTGANGALYSSNRPYGLPSITDNFSLSIGGTDEYMGLPASSDFEFGTGDFSTSLWFKPDLITVGIYYSLYDFRVNSTDKAPALYFSTNGGYQLYSYNGIIQINYGVTPTVGQWHHVAYVRTGTTGIIYLDGIRRASGADIQNYDVSSPAPRIGAPGSSVVAGYFVGSMNEVSFYDSALQDVDISAIYNCGKPADLTSLSPVGWWRMGEDATWDGTNWTIPDASAVAPATGNVGTTVSMEEIDRVHDLPS